MSDTTAIPEGYLMDSKGRLVPQHLVKGHEQLEDQTVREIIKYGLALEAQIGRFKGHTYADVGAFLDTLAEKYGATKRGVNGKGNVTLSTYDGLQQVSVRIGDLFRLGPSLLSAKDLVDQCLNKWSEGARDELKVLVTDAFRTDKQGQVSREGMFRLLHLEIQDPDWCRAMEALRESIIVEGSKTYITMRRRKDQTSKWDSIKIDMASAVVPEGMAAPPTEKPVEKTDGGEAA